ncbi:2-succinyl-5-enolpyruvyl-6-hydroxy-3-cyclohexene-1-carboxylic-acid synthase [Vibrio tapetis]|uniref:2-succinyl-5-enolpyruvyl-6-hydroxy-3-cyclohexene-1-carboxylate synthase n=1 Tax=Vibrio tapetis subsp. tapetis TaxID=1671868 RepID=A0A2N8ZDI7_9VIBR|nr:2-succinyl-5-enolpyruvyl-6-hydroxy-3-cyclohexene-1-carboxylic-acid synthase [Vibrio tapetis]SON49964.1 bifunctional 2-oxoglutarate decarboxylase and SHCHC synthase [Vibrio tapetis subsp. tapetis]
MIGQASLNSTWSTIIFEELSRHGVTDVCVAPGSRSTPLILQADAHPRLRLHRHFDERGLGFMALGLAKASKTPVAIVVTSGTAVANLLPAVAEACLTGEKLILLTADRPPELVGCGANQAIVQSGIFSSHVGWALDLPSPSERISPCWLLTSLDRGLEVQARLGGPIHINCAYPEPLYGEGALPWQHDYLLPLSSWYQDQAKQTYVQTATACEQANPPLPLWQPQRKGVVILGSISLEQAQSGLKLAQHLGWPVLCDPQSGVTSEWAHFDFWLQNPEANVVLSQCDVVIQFGARLVSKRLNQVLTNLNPDCEYRLVQDNTQRLNPSHIRMQTVVCDPVAWVNAQLNELEACATPLDVDRDVKRWSKQLADYSLSVKRDVDGIKTPTSFSETSFAQEVLTWSLQESDVFIGNSLIVRLIDMLGVWLPRETYSNRGASGIDGLVATAAGVQRYRQRPMLVMLGDTSLLHDLNSLALLTSHQSHTDEFATNDFPVVLIVTNNDGGAIFDLLPVEDDKKTALYQMPHGYQFEFAAKQFGLAYHAPQSLTECQNVVEQHFAYGKGALVVEIITPAGQASNELKRISALQQSLCTASHLRDSHQ